MRLATDSAVHRSGGGKQVRQLGNSLGKYEHARAYASGGPFRMSTQGSEEWRRVRNRAATNSRLFSSRYYFSIVSILNRHRIYLSKYFKNCCVPAARRGGLSTRGDLDECIFQVEARNRPGRSHRRGDGGWRNSQGSPASTSKHCRCAVSRTGSLFHDAAPENLLALLRGTEGRAVAGRVSLITQVEPMIGCPMSHKSSKIP
jgi:hypothetical protein